MDNSERRIVELQNNLKVISYRGGNASLFNPINFESFVLQKNTTNGCSTIWMQHIVLLICYDFIRASEALSANKNNYVSMILPEVVVRLGQSVISQRAFNVSI